MWLLQDTNRKPVLQSLLKKPTMDKDEMSSYRPISNLTTVSKVIERLVLERLRPHLLLSLIHISEPTRPY